MAAHHKPPSYFPNGQPSSPPMTPSNRSYSRFPPQTNYTSPIYKRMGLSMRAQSPPLEFIEPIGQGPRFHFTRPQSDDQSPRPSSASGRACATTPQDSEDSSDDEYESEDESEESEVESEEESTKEIERPARRVEKADFILEELDSDPGYDSDIEIVRPDHFEDARSDVGGDRLDKNGIIDQLKGLHCGGGSSDEEEQQRIYRRKKKRWSAGIFKRSHSQSVEGDSSYSDNEPLDDVDPTARRLRRRVRGPGDRSSLIFEDKGFPNANNIQEVDEPEDGYFSKGPPSIPSDDGFTLDELNRWDELPFWVEGPMEVEIESS